MYVRNRMSSNPYTVAPDATIADTLELMRNKNIRRVPVLKNGKVVGIITQSRLLEVSPSPATSLSVFEINYLMSKTKIESIMTKDVISVESSSLLEEAAIKLRDKGIGALPVIDDGHLVGIITETDVFESFIEIMGFRDKGSRIALEIKDNKPGALAEITSVIAGFEVNITHVAVFENELILRVNTIKVEEIVKALVEKGFSVISVTRNE